MSSAAVPDALLAPLLDAAADVLREMPATDVPAGLRTLAGFDRRGLVNATARQQLRRAFDMEPEFRARVVESFAARPEVAGVLEAWSVSSAVDAASDAADRDDLPLWVSALYAAEPEGAEFGLGVACSEDRHRRAARSLHDDVRAGAARVATAEEAQRRAEQALREVQVELARTADELREERRSRRDREVDAERREADAARTVREIEAALDRSRREGELAEARARREAERARDAERRLRERAREATPVASRGAPSDGAALEEAAAAARALSTRLDALLASARATRPVSAVDRGPAPRPEAAAAGPTRRVAVPCPPGLPAEHPDAVEAMLRTPGLVLLVDGYNVTMAGWPGSTVTQQRDQLLSALHRLHLRLKSHAIVVFDGADVSGVPAPRAPGVRVMFSPAGTPADHLIVEEAQSLPNRIPILVASSDGWVREQSERAGARVVPADALLTVLRR